MPKQPEGSGPETEGASPADPTSSAAEALQIVFGENFRLARLKAGLTQRDIEARTGIAQAYISQIEAGKYGLRLTTMVALATAVGRSVSGLLRQPPPSARQKSP